MQLQLITPEKIVFTGDIAMVTAPGTDGDFGVLPGHAPFISTLREGEIAVELEDGTTKRFAVESGIAEVTPQVCRFLVELAANKEEKSAA